MADITEREAEILRGLDADAQAHPIVIDKDGTARFVANKLMRHFVKSKKVNVGDVFDALAAGNCTEAEARRFYRDIGYSIGGYDEIWGSADDILKQFKEGRE